MCFRIGRNEISQAEGYVDKDVTPTMRDGRLVIPVAPGLKRKIKGIVHDESATGKTVFIEPAEVVEANNRIRELEGEERRDCNNCDHYETRELEALGHDYSNGGNCALCGKLSDGAVTGIVAGSAVAVGGGLLTVIIFVIKKKRLNIKK